MMGAEPSAKTHTRQVLVSHYALEHTLREAALPNIGARVTINMQIRSLSTRTAL